MLKKELGLLGVFSIAAGAMISSGLFVLPGLAFAKAGPAIIVSYALAGILMVPTLLSKAELSTAMPKSGGSYFFIERSLGPLAGTLAGFTNWFSIGLKAAFALVGIGALSTLLHPGVGEWEMKLVALTACVLFAVVNVAGAKIAGRLQVALVFGLLVIIGLYVFRGVESVEAVRYTAFMPGGWRSVFAVAGMVFVSFGGLTKVVGVSEEVRNPSRNLPLGMFLAFGIVNVLYVLVVFVTVGAVEKGRLAGSLVPISLGAEATMGQIGLVLVGVAALFAFATTANSGLLSASRSPMAMSKDGLLPEVFARTSKRFGTPHVSIIATTVSIMAVVAFLSVEDLVKTASTMMILMFMLVNVSMVIMRKSGLQNYRPTFKSPFFPWIQIAAVVVYGFLIAEMGAVPLLLTWAFAFLAIVWYVAYVRRRIERESAFVYLVKQVVSGDTGRSELEEELKHITIEREEISHDRFDHLVKESAAIDLEGRVSAEEFLRRISSELAGRLEMDEEHIHEKFVEREKESSTVVRPGLAIPHIIVEGEHIFELLLVRCKKGVVFSELHPPVTTAFAIVASPDERNYYLRALMTIAHIVAEPGFERMWRDARGPEALRDIVLLSSRHRETPPAQGTGGPGKNGLE